jgi:hypothetical protein
MAGTAPPAISPAAEAPSPAPSPAKTSRLVGSEIIVFMADPDHAVLDKSSRRA